MAPIYFVMVTVPDDVTDNWIAHDDVAQDTLLHLSAYWTRIDEQALSGPSISLKRTQRLTAATFDQWRQDYLDYAATGFTGL